MRRFVVLLAVAVVCSWVVCFGDDDDDESDLFDHLRNDTSALERVVLLNGHAIQSLETALDRIREKLKRKSEAVPLVYRAVEALVDHLEGTGCEENEFHCGGKGVWGHQCISSLLVCDGIKDCQNGYDEDKDYCDVSQIRAGMSFGGYYSEGRCGQSRRGTFYCKMTVRSVSRSKAFPSLMFLKMQSFCEFGNFTKRYEVVGSYQIANRKWISSSEGYTSICHFTDATFRAMYCTAREGLLTKCNNDVLVVRDD